MSALFTVGQIEKNLAWGFYGCPVPILRNSRKLANMLRGNLRGAGIETFTRCRKKFKGGGSGVTAGEIIGLSMADVHTWPEFSSLILRCFACGDKNAEVQEFFRLMRETLNPEHIYEFLGRDVHTSIPKVIPPDMVLTWSRPLAEPLQVAAGA